MLAGCSLDGFGAEAKGLPAATKVDLLGTGLDAGCNVGIEGQVAVDDRSPQLLPHDAPDLLLRGSSNNDQRIRTSAQPPQHQASKEEVFAQHVSAVDNSSAIVDNALRNALLTFPERLAIKEQIIE